MIKISQVTLIAYGSSRYLNAQQQALDKSCEKIKWGAVKNIQDDNCTNIDEWNKAIREFSAKTDALYKGRIPESRVIDEEIFARRMDKELKKVDFLIKMAMLMGLLLPFFWIFFI